MCINICTTRLSNKPIERTRTKASLRWGTGPGGVWSDSFGEILIELPLGALRMSKQIVPHYRSSAPILSTDSNRSAIALITSTISELYCDK